MGVSACKYHDARCGTGPGGTDDQNSAPPRQRTIGWRALCGLAFLAAPAEAETFRIATFSAPLSRDGPGLLLRDILKGEDEQIAATRAVIAQVNPDVLVLTDFDYDRDGLAMRAFADLFGSRYPYTFSAMPNAGLPTGLDMDRNGRLGEPRDAQGYGRFSGDGGIAILSSLPIDAGGLRDLSGLLWADFPGAELPMLEGDPFYGQKELEVQRLSSTAHWILPIRPEAAAPFTLLAYAATPPVFDGPEDRNGLRNRDELRLWAQVIKGQHGPAPKDFILAGNANLDPERGDGYSEDMAAFLADPLLQDPLPGQPTADWPEEGPGNLRVSYVLPAATWQIADAGVYWPAPGRDGSALLGDDGLAAGPHHLVWVDVSR